MVNVIGIDRVLFTTDYPYRGLVAARRFFDQIPISPICYAGRLEFSAAARPRRTRLPGICCLTMGPYPLDRVLSLMAS